MPTASTSAAPQFPNTPQASKVIPGAPASTLPGAPPADSSSGQRTPDLRFRRVHVPADQPERWPREERRYLPIEPEEFERLVQQIPGVPASAPAARLLSADYEARLSDTRLVEGRARLTVDSTSRPAQLTLDPFGLAIQSPRWLEGEQPEAMLGLTPAGGATLWVDRSGQLEMGWTLAGRLDASQGIEFDLVLPPCPASVLHIDAPHAWEPTVSPGAVAETESDDGTYRRWRIDLGGYHRASLRFASGATLQRRGLVRVASQTTTYDIALDRCTATSRLRVESLDEPLRQLVIAVDPDLTVAGCTSEGVAWQTAVIGNDKSGATRVALAPPEPLPPGAHVVEILAIGPTTAAKPWRLPLLRPRNVLWLEGTLRLMLREPLGVRQCVPAGCWQTGVRPLAEGKPGEEIEFRQHRANGTLDLHLEPREGELRVDSFSSIELAGRESLARVYLRASLSSGSQYVLDMDLAPQWQIRTVEAKGEDVLRDWSMERSDGGQRKLRLTLLTALSADRPLQATVVAHRGGPGPGRKSSLAELTPLAVPQGIDGRHYLALRAVDPLQFTVDRLDALQRVSVSAIEPELQTAFAEPNRGEIWQRSVFDYQVGITLHRPSATYSGAVEVLLDVDGDVLREEYRVRCQPDEGAVERVRVEFAPPGDQPLRWRLEGPAEGGTVRALPEDLAAEGGRHSGWEIVLPQPTPLPFELAASRQTTIAGRQAVGLAYLPDAATQQGTVTVCGSSGKAPQVFNRRLRVVPLSEAGTARVQSAVAALRYDPARDPLATEPALEIAPAEASDPTALWVWLYETESWYSADGPALHHAALYLENQSADELVLDCPQQLDEESEYNAWVDGRRVTVRRGSGARVIVPLSARKRFPRVDLQWRDPDAVLRYFGRVSPRLPSVNAPVLSRSWTVWLPPGYEPWYNTPIHRAGDLLRRWFGPLARDSSQPICDPFDQATWSPSTVEVERRTEAASLADRLLERLGAEAASPKPAAAMPNWAAAITLPSGAAEPELRVIVDQAALRDGYIDVGDSLAPASAGMDTTLGGDDALKRRGLSVLRRHGLALVVGDDQVLITSRRRVAEWRRSLTSLGERELWAVARGSLADGLQQVAPHIAEFVPAEAWRRTPSDLQSPWMKGAPNLRRASDTDEWIAAPAESASIGVGYFFRPLVHLTSIAAFMAAAGLAAWAFPSRRLLLLMLIVGALAAGAIVDEPLAVIPASLVLGTTAGVAWTIVRQSVGRRNVGSPAYSEQHIVVAGEPVSSGSVQPTAKYIPLLILIAAAPLTPLGLRAAAAADERQTVHHVLVPVDSQRKPTGDKYQVPEELYHALRRRGAAAEGGPSWMLTSARYRASLESNDDGKGHRLDALYAAYDLQVFRNNTQVRLPLDRDRFTLMPDGVQLDRTTIQADWEAEALTFEVGQPGPYRLELHMRPVPQPADPALGVDLPIPPVPDARLELTTPVAGVSVEVPLARGALEWDAAGTTLAAELGPAERLQIRWSDADWSAAPKAALDVEHLAWLRVQPASVQMHSRIGLNVIEGQLRTLSLTTDAGWRLLPPQLADGARVEVRDAASGRQTILLHWTRPLTGSASFDLVWIDSATSGLGTLQLPFIDFQEARVTRRWMAVSVDSALDYETRGGAEVDTLAVSEFIDAWGSGNSDSLPALAVRLRSAEGNFELATRLRSPTTTAEQHLTLAFSSKGAQVHCEVPMTTTGGQAFGCGLTLPAGMTVDDVRLMVDGLKRPVLWSQDRRDLTVSYLEPMNGAYRVHVDGRLTPAPGKRFALPTLALKGATIEHSTVRLFRRPDVLVRVERTEGLSPAELPPTDVEQVQWGRWIESYRVDPQKNAAAQVIVSLNKPSVSAEQVTRIERSEDGWQAQVDLRLLVSGGVLDELCLEVPPSFPGPYAVAPAAGLREIRSGDGRRILLVQPNEALRGEYRFTIRGPLVTSVGERVASPQIVLQGVERIPRYVVLPKRIDRQELAWETRGMRRSAIAWPWAGSLAPADESVVFEVLEEPARAVLAVADELKDQPRVRVAQVRLAVEPDSRVRAVATFDVEPGSAALCPLRLPLSCKLLRLRVGDVQVSPRSAGEGEWEFPVGPSRWPQRVEVVYIGPPSCADGSLRFDPPMLGDWRVEQMLWQVMGVHPRTDQETRSMQLDWHLARWRSIAETIEETAEAGLAGTEDFVRWYAPWVRRLAAARRDVERSLVAAAQQRSTRTTRIEVHAIDQRQSRLAERLGVADLFSAAATQELVADEADLLLPWAQGRSEKGSLYFIANGAAPFDAPDREAVRTSRSLGWTAGVLVAIGAVLLGSWLVGRFANVPAAIRRVARTWPEAVGVLAGVAWWLWLSPSAMGWAIVVASLVASVARPLRLRQLVRSDMHRGETVPGNAITP
ncbi:MAG: hypothetical protein ACOY3P_13425 [Planctomycetota bacterium]